MHGSAPHERPSHEQDDADAFSTATAADLFPIMRADFYPPTEVYLETVLTLG